MKKEEIQFPDWQRLFLGNAPLEFMAEVFLRTLFIYLVLLVIVRLLGKRMNAQMTIFELAVMLLLGGIVSVPMQIPERGLIQGIVILVCVLIFERGLSLWGFKNRKVELITQGDLTCLVKDGVLQLEEMKKARTSHEQIFAHLRESKVQHLGQIKRLYLEACGLFSVYTLPEPKPGLSVLPEMDKELRNAEIRIKDHYTCCNCGKLAVSNHKPHHACENCGNTQWIYAVNLEEATPNESILHEEFSLRN